MSANVEAWLGYAPGTLNVASAYWPSLVHPKDREVLLDILSDLDRREVELPLLRMLDRDGGAVAGQLRLRTLVDGTGRAFARLGLWTPASAKTRLRAG